MEEEPADQEEQPQRVEYYAAESQEPRDPPQQKLVLLPNEGEVLNGLYGQAIERGSTDSQYSRVTPRPALIAQPRPTRVKETSREPPVQTIRNYSKVNDDGSFTFGYEAADGSFKEETRGTDCVVRGKYGYVDPDGNKREFTYVSGNPCDPNAPKDEEEEEKEESEESGEENVPQNIPQPIQRRPLRPIRPLIKTQRPTTTLFAQDYNSVNSVNTENTIVPETETPQPQLFFHPAQPAAPVGVPVGGPVPGAVPGHILTHGSAPVSQNGAVHPRIRGRVPTRPLSVQLPVPSERPDSVVRVTPRPVTSSAPATLPATTYRPQLLVSVTPRPNAALNKHSGVSHTPAALAPSPSPLGSLNFEEELKRFQLENNVVTTPKTFTPQTTLKAEQQPLQPGQPVYTSELVFDPATGQYNTVLYQQIPKSASDLGFKTRLPQFQPQFQPQLQAQLQPQHQQTLPPQHPAAARQPPSNLQQQIFEQQKQALFQQSQDLYNQQRTQQLQAQQLQGPHRFQPSFTPTTLQYQPVSSTISPASTKPLSTGPQKFENPEQVQRAGPRAPNPHQFYYFAPQLDAQAQNIATGQLDAFLRGYNYQF